MWKIAAGMAMVLALPGVAQAAGICEWAAGKSDTWKQGFLAKDADAERTKNHAWMGELRKELGTKWDNAKLGEVLLPGSHDAGTFGKPNLPAAQFARTQTHSFLDQLCQGARWFDVRLKQTDAKSGVWKINHALYLFGDGADTLEQFAKYVMDPAHEDEVLFVRIKTAASTPAERDALFKKWADKLKDHVVPNAGGKKYGELTLSEIKAAASGKGARVFLLDYVTAPKKKLLGKAKPLVPVSGELRKVMWAYQQNQAGTFSNKIKLADMKPPQVDALAAWKAKPDGKVFATWWTSTGAVPSLNVRENTLALWPRASKSGTSASPSPLETFVVESKCEIGSFLVVDFYGDLTVLDKKSNLILDLARDYNRSKLGGKSHPLCAKGTASEPAVKGKSKSDAPADAPPAKSKTK